MTSFQKSKRFDIAFSHQSRRESDDVLVGVVFTPPNDPKRPSGSGVKSVPKGDFPGSTDPTADTTKTAKIDALSSCNKKIAANEKEHKNLMIERDQLLRRRNHPINAKSKENKEAEAALQAQPDHLAEITMLNTTIQDLLSKLEILENIEAENISLKAERADALEKLKLKENEISRLTSQIEEFKTTFEKEQTLRAELEVILKRATGDKKEYNLKIENFENVRVELVKEIELIKESQMKELEARDNQHQTQLEKIKAATRKQIEELRAELRARIQQKSEIEEKMAKEDQEHQIAITIHQEKLKDVFQTLADLGHRLGQ